MKMMAGEFFPAFSNAFRRLLSLSPAILLMISGPLIRKKNAQVSLATTCAIRITSTSGTEQQDTTRGLIPTDLNSCGWRRGSIKPAV
ncbi:cell division control protein 48 [Mycena galericulata]|nr:cell division control protein 48 [Mycena galericulata]